jgi:hypothetical protein
VDEPESTETTHGEDEKCTQKFHQGNLRVRNNLKNLGEEGMALQKWMIKKTGMRM